jgi:hypothetical protein
VTAGECIELSPVGCREAGVGQVTNFGFGPDLSGNPKDAH